MHRLFVAAITAAAAFSVSPVAAQARPGGYYVATPVAAPAAASFVTRNALWSCDAGVCTAPKVADRDDFVCERIAKSVGKLQAFSVGGAAVDHKTLAKCNAHAK